MAKWKQTPKHIMRKSCLEYVIRGWEPSSFIEFGAGTGDFTAVFLDKGFKGVCYDIGAESRRILRESLSDYKDSLTVVDALSEIGDKKFDYLFAFEVLEHIEDEMRALREWTAYLKPKGRVLISVPAHARKFGPDDEFHGHIRRYDKKALYDLLAGAGYKNIRIFNYGFPLGNLTRCFNSLFFKFLSKENKDALNMTAQERSIRSGVERCEKTVKLSFLFNRFFMFPFLILQKLFFNADISDGYVAYAEKG